MNTAIQGCSIAAAQCRRQRRRVPVLGFVAALVSCTGVDSPSSAHEPIPSFDASTSQNMRPTASDGATDGDRPEPPTASRTEVETDAGAAGGSKHDAETPAASASGVQPGEPCTQPEQCDDGLYCTGKELCVAATGPGGSGARCVRGEPPCHPMACRERGHSCDCALGNGDADGDGHKSAACGGDDCNDADKQIHPGATDLCDEVDDDCNPKTLGDARDDKDGDGYLSVQCRNLDRAAAQWQTGADLDDARKDVSPDAPEVCDGVDNNCDGKVDEVLGVEDHSMAFTFYRDADMDGFGAKNGPKETQIKAFCGDAVLGWALNDYDCDDASRLVAPSQGEICNGIDDNCDGHADEEPLREKPDFPGTELECRGKTGWFISKCPQSSANCNDRVSDGCETPLDTLCNCQACGVSCRFACGERGCEEIVSMAVGFNHSCALTGGSAGLAACWGYNHHGELGDDSINASALPRRVARLGGVHKLAAGYYHTCAIAGETRALSCWGDDSKGQLGANGTSTNSMVPLPVIGVPSGLMTRVADIAVGAYHTCAIQADSTVACWGQGDDGRLGDGIAEPHNLVAPSVTRAEPGDVYLKGAKQIAAGFAHSCAIVGDRRELFCWGNNSYGQLGDGTASSSSAATPISALSEVDELALGANHGCARARGQVFCWGNNSYGQLGRAQSAAAPIQVDGLKDVVSIAAGAQHSCAVQADGNAYCWGLNSSGELGSSQVSQDMAKHSAPVRVELDAVERVFAGQGQHVCAIAGGKAVCWGSNVDGELGNGKSTSDSAVTAVMVSALDGSKACEK